jgi:hypothetical protein
MYYLYSAQALNYFRDDARLAGISLYALWFNGYTHLPFVPLPDDSDVFFLQIPYFHGQAFTASQWKSFRDWLKNSDPRVKPDDPLHDLFLKFKDDEWFPVRTKYLVETGRFFVYPRISLCSGFGDPGAHFTKTSHFFQVPLQNAQKSFRLKSLDHSFAVYDSFFEMLPERINQLNPALGSYPYEVDLNGTKSPEKLKADLILTSQLYGKRSRFGAPLRTFGKVMWPLEANVIYGIPGNEIALCRKEAVKTDWLSRLAVKKGNYDYYNRYQPVGKRLLLQYFMIDLLRKMGWHFD